IDRAVPARLLADPHAVLHLGRDRAADCAMRADALARVDRDAGTPRWACLGPAQPGERQRADGRQAGGDETGAAQERATGAATALPARPSSALPLRTSRRPTVRLPGCFMTAPP